MISTGGLSPPASNVPEQRGGRWIAALTLTVSFGLAATLAARPRPVLLWNASSSSPVGLYAIGSAGDLVPGDIAIAWPPQAARRLAAERHYLPAQVPLVKAVAATSGARVCAHGNRILIDARAVAVRRSRDRRGRALPSWSGCRRLRPGDLFLLAANRPDAFDGRYFGVTRGVDVIGKGWLLWAG